MQNYNSKLKIITYPNSLLRKKCQEVKEITEDIKKFSQEMIKIMIENKGIGLAAPQVGVLKRVIIALTDNGPKAFINPKIIKKTKETEIMEEGCLSFPGLFLEIKRWKGVEIEALDGNGNKIKATGLLARILQHEIDHLDGILFIDRISFWQRLKIKKKLKEFEKSYGSN